MGSHSVNQFLISFHDTSNCDMLRLDFILISYSTVRVNFIIQQVIEQHLLCCIWIAIYSTLCTLGTYSFFTEFAHAFDIYQVYIKLIILIKIQTDSYMPPCGKSMKFSYPAADTNNSELTKSCWKLWK